MAITTHPENIDEPFEHSPLRIKPHITVRANKADLSDEKRGEMANRSPNPLKAYRRDNCGLETDRLVIGSASVIPAETSTTLAGVPTRRKKKTRNNVSLIVTR